ncbi:hypothetical protein Taro_008981 [Colocasia esculenta]|uniref:Uncharacterized protein n=1 Tax=Colocasia esculenta TaxID=4460 RepID=A0A843U541_COLES|nr:hypothetical protein [Colocasia esculenta]
MAHVPKVKLRRGRSTRFKNAPVVTDGAHSLRRSPAEFLPRLWTKESLPFHAKPRPHSSEFGAGVPVVFLTQTRVKWERLPPLLPLSNRVIKRGKHPLPRPVVLVEEERNHIPAQSLHTPTGILLDHPFHPHRSSCISPFSTLVYLAITIHLTRSYPSLWTVLRLPLKGTENTIYKLAITVEQPSGIASNTEDAIRSENVAG